MQNIVRLVILKQEVIMNNTPKLVSIVIASRSDWDTLTYAADMLSTATDESCLGKIQP